MRDKADDLFSLINFGMITTYILSAFAAKLLLTCNEFGRLNISQTKGNISGLETKMREINKNSNHERR